MFKITKDGTSLGMTEAPTYIKHQENGCFALCLPAEAEGIAYNGAVYHLLGRPALEGLETVMVEEMDAGAEITETQGVTASNVAMTGQVVAAAQVYARTATAIPDETALQMKNLFQTWENVLDAGEHLAGGVIINDGGTLYRVVGANGVDPMPHQPPHGEGMLAIYRPIDQTHAGTLEDPIPWAYGMDCEAGKYYTHASGLWRCAYAMPACIWAPGSPGVWQWEAVE